MGVVDRRRGLVLDARIAEQTGIAVREQLGERRTGALVLPGFLRRGDPPKYGCVFTLQGFQVVDQRGDECPRYRMFDGTSALAWVMVPVAGLWVMVSVWLGRRQKVLAGGSAPIVRQQTAG